MKQHFDNINTSINNLELSNKNLLKVQFDQSHQLRLINKPLSINKPNTFNPPNNFQKQSFVSTQIIKKQNIANESSESEYNNNNNIEVYSNDNVKQLSEDLCGIPSAILETSDDSDNIIHAKNGSYTTTEQSVSNDQSIKLQNHLPEKDIVYNDTDEDNKNNENNEDNEEYENEDNEEDYDDDEDENEEGESTNKLNKDSLLQMKLSELKDIAKKYNITISKNVDGKQRQKSKNDLCEDIINCSK
jgi:hypothetical protein